MNRADEFVRLYNELTDRLGREARLQHHVSFVELVEQAARRNPVVRRNISLLRDYAELRNSIVHYHSYPGEYVAEPTERTLERFRRLVDQITNRRRLYPTHRKDVRVFDAEEPFTDALRYMDEKDYSQVVIRKDGELKLLTAEGVAEWLQSRAKDPELNLSEYTVGQVHDSEKGEKSAVMKRTQTVDEALDLFSETALNRRSCRIFAILVTQNGKRTEKPLGIVTAWDLLKDKDEG